MLAISTALIEFTNMTGRGAGKVALVVLNGVACLRDSILYFYHLYYTFTGESPLWLGSHDWIRQKSPGHR